MLVPGLAMSIVAISFGAEVMAESTSASYKAVDFINPEASLSTSTTYQLSDSIDYYGGINTSPSYQECTGDFAVLGGCKTPPLPPPPPAPPTPPPGGGGSGCTTCTPNPPYVPPVVTPPVPPVKPVEKPFVLPKITEPGAPVVVTPPAPVPPVAPVRPAPDVPKVVANLPNEVVSLSGGGSLEQQIKTVEEGKLIKVIVLNFSCKDLQCPPGDQLRGTAEGSGECFFKIYTFGGFVFIWSCQDAWMLWLLFVLLCIFVVRLVDKKLSAVEKAEASESQPK